MVVLNIGKQSTKKIIVLFHSQMFSKSIIEADLLRGTLHDILIWQQVLGNK